MIVNNLKCETVVNFSKKFFPFSLYLVKIAGVYKRVMSVSLQRGEGKNKIKKAAFYLMCCNGG